MVATDWIGPSLFILFLGGCAPRGVVSPPDLASPVDFSVSTLDGTVVRWSDLEGRVTLVDIWATWCRPCEKSFPFYADLHRRFESRGLSVLAVSVDQHVDEVERFVRRNPVPFRVAHDPKGLLAEQWNVRTMPTAFILDRRGRVAYVHEGFEDSDGLRIEQEVKRVVQAK